MTDEVAPLIIRRWRCKSEVCFTTCTPWTLPHFVRQGWNGTHNATIGERVVMTMVNPLRHQARNIVQPRVFPKSEILQGSIAIAIDNFEL